MHRPKTRHQRLLVPSILSAALLGALSMPAFATDPPCRNPDGSDVTPAPSTGQGSEGGLDNTTCHMFASAFGQYNNASGDISSAFGWENNAWNEAASAFGAYNIASGGYSNAFGYKNTAGAWETSAFGAWNSANGVNSSAFGHRNTASGQDSSAFGDGNRAYGNYSNAFGLWSGSNTYATAVGLRGYAQGLGSVAIAGFFDRNGNGHEDLDIAGSYSTETAYAAGSSSIAVGAGVQATGNFASAVGVNNVSSASGANSFGIGNVASGLNSTAIGSFNTASGQWSGVFGYSAQAPNTGSVAIGYQSIADRDYAISMGQAGAEHQIIHLAAGTEDTDAVNLGQLNAALAGISGFGGFSISANGDVAETIGDGETVDFRAVDPNGNLTVSRSGNTLSYGFAGAPTFAGLTVGGGGASFTIVNNTIVNMGNNVVAGVADGVAATDAVNKGQLDAGLATANNAAAAAQSTADSALAAAGTAQTTADNALAAAGTAQTTADQAAGAAAAAQGTADTALSAANAAQASADAAQATANTAITKADAAQATADTAVTKADAAQSTADTALAAAGNAITVANDYTDARETAIRTDMTAGDAATLTASNTYTDTRSAQTLASANAYTDGKFAAWNDAFTQYQQQVDHRFAQTDRRIDRLGAMGGAMAAAAINTAGLPGQNRIGLGVGTQNGRSAIAIGYQRLLRPNVSVSLTGAFSGNDRAVSAGTDFSW